MKKASIVHTPKSGRIVCMKPSLSRRDALRFFGAGLSVLAIPACNSALEQLAPPPLGPVGKEDAGGEADAQTREGEDASALDSSATDSGHTRGDAQADAAERSDAAADSGTDGASDGGSRFARGGTKAMQDPDSYPNPFNGIPATCALAVRMTGGPCTENADRVRRDVSEGAPGLPMRLWFRVLDANCQLLSGATVKIWHTNVRGSYTGDTPNNAFCISEAAAAKRHEFRGVQTSDTYGNVIFDTCFPGWYPGRAIHIHFTVTHNGKSTTSQVFFEQALIDEIFATHPDYAPFGKPDTPNARDGVGGPGIVPMTTIVQVMPDGALLAAKDLIVLSA
jgi:protocatechuate 3,4-dioxygenase beta subunit